jgi:type VI secretion system secreted protein VgrG
MARYLQADRFLTVTTPLETDALLLRRLSGHEALSRPFLFKLELAAVHGTDVPFERLLGQPVTAHLGLSAGRERHVNGVCRRVTEAGRDATFTYYRMEVVPALWLLSLRVQSRIFQQAGVPDILRAVFAGLDVSYQLRGTYHPRDYCVQYVESDLDFASRLMEEEGIFYFFTHADGGHRLVVADAPEAHPGLADPAAVVYGTSEVGGRHDDRVTAWEKSQALRPGRFALRDHCFELPDDPLDASRPVPPTAQAGQVEHRLRPGPAERLEDYRYPGAFAQRFDGVDPGGGDRAADLRLIPGDGTRTAGLRAQESAAASLVVTGSGHCRHFAGGHRFTLRGHFNADGDYVLLSVHHQAALGGDYRSEMGGEPTYRNRFRCIPASVAFRPARVTPRPVIHGTQSAVVVGPHGEEIFTDKYGRVKVQFPWDRQGRHDAGSSCWVRVGSPWAGQRWGAVHIPRVGQEVIVAFEEGDPDRPLIIGSVYNAAEMPPYLLPGRKMVSGVKSNTYRGGGGYNEFVMDDTKGAELVRLHAQHDMDATVENDSRERVVHNRHLIVGTQPGGQQGGDLREYVANDRHEHVGRHRVEHVEGNLLLTVGNGQVPGGNVDLVIGGVKKELVEGDSHEHVMGARKERVGGLLATTVSGDRAESVGGAQNLQVRGDRREKVGGTQSLTVAVSQQEKVGQNHALEAGMEIHLKAGMKVVIEAGVQLSLKGPGGFIDIGPAGVAIQGTMVLINSGGAAGDGSGASPQAPTAPAAPTNASPAAPIAPDPAGRFTT